MSQKRTSPESGTDVPLNEDDSDPTFQQDGDTKRNRLVPLYDTTLLDLPLELIEHIFVRTIVMEVKDLHLSKSVWKDKAELVISRLSSVCPEWSNILTTNFFQNELHRNLDRIVEKTIRLEVVNHTELGPEFIPMVELITLKNELGLFVIGLEETGVDYEIGYQIRVFDRNNFATVKDVVYLPQGIERETVAACHVTNCLYMLDIRKHDKASVLRITKEEEHKFVISPLLNGSWNGLAVAENGNLILWKGAESKQSTKIAVCDANGSLQQEMKFSSDLYGFRKLIPKSNGNLVVVSTRHEFDYRTKLTEIDVNGTVLRQHKSSFKAYDSVCLADRRGRVVIVENLNKFELLDNEFNVLNVIAPQLDIDYFYYFVSLNYNIENKEFVAMSKDEEVNTDLYIFHLTEE